VLTKGVTELVESCDCFLPERRSQTIQAILSMARDMKMPTSGLPVHQQVMLATWLAIVGIGPGGAAYADDAIRRYAVRHRELEAVKDIALSARNLACRAYGYSANELAPYNPVGDSPRGS
jgi:hypothetical protein